MKHFYCIFMFPLKNHTPVPSCTSIVIISIDIMSLICSVVSKGHAAKHGCTVYEACYSANAVACILYRLVVRQYFTEDQIDFIL